MKQPQPKITSKKIKRLLIANRGEIALRIIRSARELNIETVAVYSDADDQSLHRFAADFAVRLPGETSAETYLDQKRVIEAAVLSQVDAVHPGYGFLSENADFAEAVIKAGLIFVGPTPQAIHSMGDKVEAKNLMRANRIPVVPGSENPCANFEELKRDAKNIAFPLIIKAAAGGGGRGMRVVYKESELQDAYEACVREASAYFGNPAVFCERYIENPRHIEFQVLFDQHGHGVHLFERDCSIQRRHQKLIEEAPSTFLNEEQRARLGEIAVRAASAVGYTGAGTVEFICNSPEETYFMEMNTRIQVEHPVTEMITGFDLIAEQLRVAQGEPLKVSQADIKLHGWAFEARINVEDVQQGFLPCPGRINSVSIPGGPFVRVDTHIYSGYEVPRFYDSMVAKLIVWGRDRNEALARLKRCLGDMIIDGLPTTIPFHEWLIEHPKFVSGQFTTRFLEREEVGLEEFFGSTQNSFSERATMAALSVEMKRPRFWEAVESTAYCSSQNWQKVARNEACAPARGRGDDL